MYAALWRVLPRPVWLKILILVVGAAAVLAVCVLWVFPWIDQTFLEQDGSLGGGQ